MNKKKVRNHVERSQMRVTLYLKEDERDLIDQFFDENSKWKKGAFFLEAALEKIQRDEAEQVRRSHESRDSK